MAIVSPEIGCGRCKYVRYDSWFDENWCDHNPPPDGLCERLLVDIHDICEYFEEE